MKKFRVYSSFKKEMIYKKLNERLSIDFYGNVTSLSPLDIIMESTGKKIFNDRELYEGDIVFEEVEHEHGDERIYFVCIWIDEWSRFVLLNTYEYIDYRDNGIDVLEDDGTFGLDCKSCHYGGNIYENAYLIENPESIIERDEFDEADMMAAERKLERRERNN